MVVFSAICSTMTVPLFLGCSLFAFAPAAAMCYLVVLQRPQLTIVAVSNGFVWLLSLLLCSLVWMIIPPLKDVYSYVVVVSVVVQELVRYGAILAYYKVVEKIKARVSQTERILPLTSLSASLSAGVGVAIMYSLVMYGQLGTIVLTSPGTYYRNECPSMSIYLSNALHCFLFSILHMVWMILGYDAFQRKSWHRGAVVFGTHLVASLLSLLSRQPNDGCVQSMISIAVVTVFVLAYLHIQTKDAHDFLP